MMKLGKTKIAKEKFILEKNLKKNWDVNVDNIIQNQLKESLIQSI